MVGGEGDHDFLLLIAQVGLQDDRVRVGGAAPAGLVVQEGAQDQLHGVRVTAHGTQQDPAAQTHMVISAVALALESTPSLNDLQSSPPPHPTTTVHPWEQLCIVKVKQ